MRTRIGAAAAVAIMCGFAAGATQTLSEEATPGDAVKSIGKDLPPGFLPRETLPDSNGYLPPAPAGGSAREQRDQSVAKSALALNGTTRFKQAVVDADLTSPDSINKFSCAAGVELGPQTTPATNALLRRTIIDLGIGGYPTKSKYKRKRPFMINGAPSCTPEQEKLLSEDGSYPSGHSAVGYGWGLILAELLPARGAQLMERAREFGDSRVVCNVHWISDVEEGRNVASVIFAQLHTSPDFQAGLAAAKAELEKAQANPPKADCASEAATLAVEW